MIAAQKSYAVGVSDIKKGNASVSACIRSIAWLYFDQQGLDTCVPRFENQQKRERLERVVPSINKVSLLYRKEL